MKCRDELDYSKLLGFAAVSEQVAEGIDFQNETVGARLGAKVGNENQEPPKSQAD
jgi:hypothetical protein